MIFRKLAAFKGVAPFSSLCPEPDGNHSGFGVLKPRWPVEPHVPLYFFDIRDGEAFIRDEEGLWFPDFKSAEREAAEAAAAILLDARRSDRPPSTVTIE